MKSFAIAAGALVLCIAAHPVRAADRADDAAAAARLLAEQVCSVCHGAGGRNTFPDIPNLAAQSRQYLVAKIKMFRDRAQGKPAGHIDVLGLTLMDDPTVEALARYFAEQAAPPPLAGDTTLVAAGGKIYARGVPEQRLAPCGVCHGPEAAGIWIFPRLAGQHAGYVERQIALIQERLRDAPVMHGIIKTMTPEEIKAVAAFVQSK